MRTVTYSLIILLGALGYRMATSPAWQDAVSGAAIAVIKPILIPLVLAIAAPAFVYIVSLLILLAAFAACIAYGLSEVRPRRRQIGTVRRGVLDLPQPGAGRVDPGWHEAMHGLGTLLRDNAIFVSAWSEYQARTAQSGRMPDAPFSHFVASEPESRGRVSFMHSLPGYFTSLGLIFTFIGLVVALYFAAKGFRSGSMEEARAAIIQLLNTASFKFLTSVAALIAAMIISLFLRFNLATIAREMHELAERIEAYLTIWREQLNAGHAAALSDKGLTARFEALLDQVERLARAVEALARRDRARLVGPDHAIR